MRVIGIDPGVSGAIAVMEKGGFYCVHDMPTVTVGKTRKRREIAESLLYSILRDERPDKVIIEQVASMPGQGVASVFSFGMSYGVIRGITASLGVPWELVTPQCWKKATGLIGSDKDEARALAIRKYPDAAEHLTRKKDIGRADAIHIAAWGCE